MDTKEEKMEALSKFSAAYLVLLQAADLMNNVLEREAHKLGMEHKQETKMHLNAISRAASSIKKDFQFFTEWAYEAGVTDKGETHSAHTYDVLMTDASYLAQLVCHTFNAAFNDDNARLMIESTAKTLAKRQLIKQKYIDQLKVNI